ncbi:MAG: FAD-binding oxidoreductase, partial [Sandarakinorhabdus sp.]|nr:FAD-binding oxidoreductase [Sandarakinorhabdus sp.]
MTDTLTPPAAPNPRPQPPAFLAALQQRFGPQCSTALAQREQHGRDESAYVGVPPPDAVVYAESTTDVADAVRLCAQHQVPLIPYGAGSSLEGQLLALHGGISLDLSRMNRVLAIYPDDLCATVQPGVTRMQLNAALRDQGLFFPIDPGADASLGGMAAT